MGWIGRYGKVWRSYSPTPHSPRNLAVCTWKPWWLEDYLWLFLSGSYITTFLKNFWKLLEIWRMKKLEIRIQNLENLCLSEFLFLAFHRCHLRNDQNLVVHQSGAMGPFLAVSFLPDKISYGCMGRYSKWKYMSISFSNCCCFGTSYYTMYHVTFKESNKEHSSAHSDPSGLYIFFSPSFALHL